MCTKEVENVAFSKLKHPNKQIYNKSDHNEEATGWYDWFTHCEGRKSGIEEEQPLLILPHGDMAGVAIK